MSQNWFQQCILGGQYGLAQYADIHDDEELRLLQRSLPYVAKNGVAGSTFNKYKSAWDKWLRWSDTKHLSGRPGEPYYVAIYFNHLLFVHHNRGCLAAAFYGVRWGHHIVGLESPTENPLVKLAYDGAVRMRAGPREKKDPISVEIIKDLVEKYCTKNATRMDLRFITVCLTGFAGFLRIDELLRTQLKHVTIFEDHVLQQTNTGRGTK